MKVQINYKKEKGSHAKIYTYIFFPIPDNEKEMTIDAFEIKQHFFSEMIFKKKKKTFYFSNNVIEDIEIPCICSRKICFFSSSLENIEIQIILNRRFLIAL